MTDENIPSAGPPPGAQPSWTPPPPSAAPPPPPPDSTGSVPAPAESAGTGVSIDNPVALALGVIAVAGVVLGLLLRSTQGGTTVKLWDTMGWAWAILAIAAAAATLLPAVGALAGLPERTAWLVAAIGAGLLGLWWVLFVLPYIQLNTAFLATVGVLAAAGATWLTKPADVDAATEPE